MAYVDAAALVAVLGQGADPDRAATAAAAACEWVDARAGTTFTDPVPARITQLALNAGLRFYHDPDAPYGVIGGSADVPMYMKSLMTDSEHLLLGLRSGFGLG
jgi:hypothetical protein